MNVNGNDVKSHSKFKSFISFDWDEYLQSGSDEPAPKDCFNQNPEPPVNEFEFKQKLEITSPDSVDFVHLATVVNFFGSRLQLRLDGCDNSNDIFELVDSEAINSIGTRQIRNKYFAAPLRFRKDAASYNTFCQQILKNSVHAPKSAFKPPPKPPSRNSFKVGQKLEAVDIKHPSNICPASIVDVDRNHVEIHLLGWDSNNDYKCSYLSRNLFPVGWCKSTGHPLQHPGPKAESKVVKKEFNNSTSTVNATDTVNNCQQNNVNTNETGPVLIKTESNQPKPTIPIVSSSELKMIMQTNSNKNNTNITNVSPINTVTTTASIATTTSTTTPLKFNLANVKSKSNNDQSVNIKNVNNIKNEKNNEFKFQENNSANKNVIINNDRGIKRQFDQIVVSDKTNSNSVKVNRKPALQLTSQTKLQSKYASQLMPTSHYPPKLVTQPKQATQPKLAIQIKSPMQPKVVTQSKVSVQPKPSNQPSIISPQPKPTIQQQLAAQHQTTAIHASTISQSSSIPSQSKPSQVSNNVPIVNGNKASLVSQYATNFPSSKVVNTWSVEDVVEFLNLRLPEFSKYENQFRSHEIDGKAFLLLTNESMMKFMSIKLGYSLKICNIVDKIIESDSSS